MRALVLSAGLVLGVAACSSTTGDSADASVDSAIVDAKAERDPSKNCVKPGTPNNDKGLAGYCEPDGLDCVTDVGVALCSGGFGAPDDHWFCTKPCGGDGDCGSGAYCDKSDPRGFGCVPNVCGDPPDAGGSDAATEASLDATTDVAKD
jgi:hypothetical protein